MIAALALGLTLMRCPTPVRYAVDGATSSQAWAVRAAVWQAGQASGQDYELSHDDPTLIISFVGPTDPVLQSHADWAGYTTPGPRIGISATVPPGAWTQALVMHELMLARGLPEAPDPGGLLGHLVDVQLQTYSTADTLMLAGTACQ